LLIHRSRIGLSNGSTAEPSRARKAAVTLCRSACVGRPASRCAWISARAWGLRATAIIQFPFERQSAQVRSACLHAGVPPGPPTFIGAMAEAASLRRKIHSSPHDRGAVKLETENRSRRHYRGWRRSHVRGRGLLSGVVCSYCTSRVSPPSGTATIIRKEHRAPTFRRRGLY